jgi:FAD/FMN-containing dehydrogenase
VAGRLSRRQLLKRAALVSATLSVPFICRRYSYAGEIDPAVVRKFGGGLKGRLLLPGDANYNSERRLWNARYDKHPAMIAQCANTDDVVRTVEFARKNDRVVSIRSGGHDPAGFSTNDGGVVIDLRPMKAISIDVAHNVASSQPGMRVSQLYEALSGHRLVAVSGTCPTVGIGGLTTGGGVGWISNKYGTASDNVVRTEVVTADGRLIQAAPDQNSDLFWAVCGGSGNFGVVTGFELQTISMARVTKGALSYPASQFGEVLRFCREFVATAPEEVTLAITYGVPGPADQVFLTVCYCGDPAKSEKVIKPLRSFAKATSDDIRSVPAHLGLVDEEPESLSYFEGDAALPRLSDDAIDVLAEAIKGAPSLYALEIFPFGGKIIRGSSAYPFRFSFFEVDYTAFWREENDRPAAARWVERLRGAMGPFSRGGYVNSLGNPDMAHAAFGDNYDRLLSIKNKYDPTNFFRMNQNIKPTV